MNFVGWVNIESLSKYCTLSDVIIYLWVCTIFVQSLALEVFADVLFKYNILCQLMIGISPGLEAVNVWVYVFGDTIVDVVNVVSPNDMS